MNCNAGIFMIYPGLKKKEKRETKTLTDFHSNYLQKTFELSLLKGPSCGMLFSSPGILIGGTLWNAPWLR